MPSVNNYDQFGKLLKQVIKADDTEIADRLLTHLYPFLSEEDQLEVSTDILGHALKRGSLAIKQLFIQRLGLSPEAAYEYIKDCLENPERDRDLVDDAARHLEHFYAVLQVGAVILGDLEIAELLLKHKPDRDIVFDYSGIRDARIFLDGEECWFRNEHMHDISSIQMKRAFSILAQAGLRDVFDHKTPIIGEGSFKDSRHSTKSVAFKGDLPMITDGVLTNPELFLAFTEKRSQSAFGKVYDKIPCWIKDVEHEHSEQVIKYNVDQHFTLKSDNDKVEIISNSMPADQFDRINSHSFVGIRLCVKCANKEILTDTQSMAADVLVMEMLPLHLQCGMGAPPGYVLAIVDLDYLSQFGAGRLNLQNMSAAKEFADQFFPATVLFNSHTYRSSGMSDGEIGVNSHNCSDVFTQLLDPSMADGLLQLIPENLWLNLFRSASYKLDAHELLNAKKLFGFTNLHGDLSLNLKDVLVLHAAGYEFDKTGERAVLNSNEAERDANPKIVVKYIQMGGWPSTLPRPESMEEAMSLAVRKRSDPIYLLHLQAVGAEACMKAASTISQYKLVLELFSSAEVNPHLKLLPKNLRGKHLEDVMGL